ncbi:MAG: dihydrolipoyl dehydrogenase [Deltaproteobacteria bacterium]|nr:dihydrolipoyl dehydrogenase [Deltaproteobacteria bacterium]
MMSDKYNLIVIGAGPGGHAAAEHAAKGGAGVAVIEKSQWGGTCSNRGCIPTKALLACSKQYANLKKLKRLGISPGEASFDYAAMKRHQRQMVTTSSLGVQKSLKDAGVDMKSGEGRLIAPREVELLLPEGAVKRLIADTIIIAWGSEPLLPPHIKPSCRILTSDGFLALETLPESVIIVGGSVIGVEFATFLAELGVKVALVELLDRILPLEDKDAAEFLRQELTRLGITIHTAANVESLRETPDGVHLKATHNMQDLEITADLTLLCTGRKPLLRTDELDQCGIGYNQKGIIVNENQMTNREGIYAIGDVTGGIMLAHRAIHQGKSVAGYLTGDHPIRYKEEAVPSVIYTHPGIARVGLTETQAIERGLKVETKRVEYAANIMARTDLKGNGFVKATFCEDRLIGVTIAGDDAGELIASMSLAVANGMGKKELKKWIIPHPTLSEILCLL